MRVLPALDVTLEHVAYRLPKICYFLHAEDISEVRTARGKYPFQILLFRAGNDLMDLAFPTAAFMFRGYQCREHADGNEAGHIKLIQGPAVELHGSGNAGSVQLASRLRPDAAANPDLAQRLGTLMKETIGRWYFLEPSAAGPELANFSAL